MQPNHTVTLVYPHNHLGGLSQHIVVRKSDLASLNNFEDVVLYIRSCLETIREDNIPPSLPSGWPGNESISALAAVGPLRMDLDHVSFR